MKRLTLLTVAIALGLIFSRTAYGEVVLEITTKLGVQKKIRNPRVDSQVFAYRNKEGLTLASIRPYDSSAYPQFYVFIPWKGIKTIEFKFGVATVTCNDGARYSGLIVTVAYDADGNRYPLWDCRQLAVTGVQQKPGLLNGRPVPKVACNVAFGRAFPMVFYPTNMSYYADEEKGRNFEMVIKGEKVSGVFSDFAKVVITGSEKGPIKIAVQPPNGSTVIGDLVVGATCYLEFTDSNGTNVLTFLRRASILANPQRGEFRIAISAAKGNQQLPRELFPPIIPKKR